MDNQINIPALRFPEFKGEWEKKKLGEVAEFKAGYAFKSEQMLSEKSNFQLLKMSNVYKNELRLDRNASYWEKLSSKEKEFLLKEGDTILTLTGTVGKQDYGYSVQIKENNKYLLNQRLVLLRELKNKSNNDFIFQIISNEIFLFYFFAEAKGGTGNQTNVGTDDVKNIQLFFPTLPEQTKIASFLTAVDEKMQALKKKKRLLEDYKKGVMQRIFSNAPTPASVRFKDENGNDFPDWEVKKLGEVCVEHRLNNKNKETQEVFSVAKHKGVINQIEHLGRSFSAKEILHYKLIFPGDLVYTKSPTSDFPFGIIKQNRTGRIGVVSPLYCVFRPKTFALGYLLHEYFDSSINTLNYLSPLVQKGAKNTMNINNDTFLNGAGLLIPINEKEQTIIANFLSALDEKINQTTTQIEKTETWKKGLLQKMFV